MPTLSVLVNCLNAQSTIDSTMASLSSLPGDFEVIVVDNQSTDNTNSMLQSFAEKDPRIKLWKTDRKLSLGAARNFGLSKCQGELITFLDADDLAFLPKVDQQVNIMLNNDVDITFASWLALNSTGKITGFHPINCNDDVIEYLFSNNINFQAVMIKRSIIEKNKILFSNDLSFCEDFLFLYRLLFYCNKIYFVKDFVAGYRYHETSMSSTQKWRKYFEFCKIFSQLFQFRRKNITLLRLSCMWIKTLIAMMVIDFVSFSKNAVQCLK